VYILKKNRVELLYKKKLELLCFFTYILCFASLSLSADTQTISVMSFNVWNYFVKGEKSYPIKDEYSRNAVAATIANADPDIIMLSEIGGEKSVKDLSGRLSKLGLNYKYLNVMHGCDSWRHLGILAKLSPVTVDKQTELTYKIHPKKMPSGTLDTVPVQRGFFHLIFKKGKYKLHIISAHLKAKLFNSRYNQTDMRRSEARLLRYLVDDILKKNPDANLLVVGDFNDSCNSNPLKLLRGDTLKQSKRKLTDLKLYDRWHNSWTHWWHSEDSYSRIDYALASSGLIKEVDFSKSRIIHIPKLWNTASDHRPLMTVITAKDR
jgi:endonuclease/exonuclease/phosphatase family metal-dependent hydrolase